MRGTRFFWIVAAAACAAAALAGAQAGPARADNGSLSFVRSDVATGLEPDSVAVGDLNGDGVPDLAVANYSGGTGGTVSVLLGNGDGSFQPKTDFATGSGPFSVAVGDLNGDGRPDLAVANSNDGTVSVLLGNGDGSFQTKTDVFVGGEPFSVAIGDLNGDGHPDLAVAEGLNANWVSVLLGNGDGSFKSPAAFTIGGYESFSVAIGDLNADGRADLAVANYDSSTVSVLLGNGDGSFQNATDFATGSNPTSVAVGDLNADGRPDLAVAENGTVSVLLGNGDGSFRAKTDFATSATQFGGFFPVAVAIGDLDGDGHPDLAVAGGNTVSVLLGIGDGSFQPKTDFVTGFGASSLAIGHLNGDRRPDLAVATVDASTVSVLLSPEPLATVAPDSLDLGHAAVGLHSASQTVTVTNTGTASLHVSAATLTGPDADEFSVSGGDCIGSVVLVGQSCSISVRFGPLAVGAGNAVLKIASDAPSAVTVALTGTGDPPYGIGAQGPAGPEGPAGPQGAQGATGAQGSQGPAGPATPAVVCQPGAGKVIVACAVTITVKGTTTTTATTTNGARWALNVRVTNKSSSTETFAAGGIKARVLQGSRQAAVLKARPLKLKAHSSATVDFAYPARLHGAVYTVELHIGMTVRRFRLRL